MLRLLSNLLLLASAHALSMPANSPCTYSLAHTQPRITTQKMAMPTLQDAKSLSDDDLEQEIVNAKKELFELRKSLKTRQQVKPHLFTHTKHRIAQLSYLLDSRQTDK